MVFYTLSGGILGFGLSWLYSKVTDADWRSNGFLPSEGAFICGIGTIIGASLGFGFGFSRFMNGHYLP